MVRDMLVRLGLLDEESESPDVLWILVTAVALWGTTRLVRRRVRGAER
jgi:hypothetical protein